MVLLIWAPIITVCVLCDGLPRETMINIYPPLPAEAIVKSFLNTMTGVEDVHEPKKDQPSLHFSYSVVTVHSREQC